MEDAADGIAIGAVQIEAAASSGNAARPDAGNAGITGAITLRTEPGAAGEQAVLFRDSLGAMAVDAACAGGLRAVHLEASDTVALISAALSEAIDFLDRFAGSVGHAARSGQ